MARPRRTTWLKVTACVFAIASLTINFGLIDLIDGFTGYVDQARNQVLDVGWGAVFGLILPFGLLSQLRSRERRIAGVQQTAVVAVALVLAGAAGQRPRYFALAAGHPPLSARPPPPPPHPPPLLPPRPHPRAGGGPALRW